MLQDRGLTQVVLDSYLHNIENQSSHLNDNGPPPSKPNVIHTSPPPHSKYGVNLANNSTPASGVNIANNSTPASGALIIDPELVNTDPVSFYHSFLFKW